MSITIAHFATDWYSDNCKLPGDDNQRTPTLAGRKSSSVMATVVTGYSEPLGARLTDLARTRVCHPPTASTLLLDRFTPVDSLVPVPQKWISFSSAGTVNCFRSIAEAQPQLQPALVRLSSDHFPKSSFGIGIHRRLVKLESRKRTVARQLPTRLLVENRNRRRLWMAIGCQSLCYVLLLHCIVSFPHCGSDPRFSIWLATIQAQQTSFL